MIMNERLEQQLKDSLHDCGFDTSEPRGKSAAFGILLDGEEIGYMDKSGQYHLMEDFTGERDRLTNILNFSNDFRYHPEKVDGERKLMAFGNALLSASLDVKTGKPIFHVSQMEDENHRNHTTDFADFNEAKYAFATRSRLYDPDFAARRQERFAANRFMELARDAGYQFKEVDHPTRKWELFTKTNQSAGYITQNDEIVAKSNLKSMNKNIDSLYAQAKWEVSKEQNGQSYFLQKVTDALRQLGYTIKHAWQRLSLAATIHDGQNQIGAIDPHGQVQVQPTATPKQSTEIDEVVKRVKEEIHTEFQQYQKTMTRVETQTQGAEQSVSTSPQEEKPTFTNQEMLFVKALLCSAACKDLVAKNVDMNDIAKSLSEKIKDNYPTLPDYSKKETAQTTALKAVRPTEEAVEMEN